MFYFDDIDSYSVFLVHGILDKSYLLVIVH